MNLSGILYVVATPIGNLKDITLRAIEVLKEVDHIAAEDTRHSGPLLKHFSINKPTISLHEFNEREKADKLISLLKSGKHIALISDAGTPLISDPGYHLVKQAKEEAIKVVPIPGACAAIAALSVSGLPTDKFIFEGFLPVKEEAKRQQLMQFFDETRSVIFYEAPHRLLATLRTLHHIFGDARLITVARELTKLYESTLTMPLIELLTYYEDHEKELRGEIVIILSGTQEAKKPLLEISSDHVLDSLLEVLPIKQAVLLASKITGERKNLLYERALIKKKAK